jgi:hypothetical protein
LGKFDWYGLPNLQLLVEHRVDVRQNFVSLSDPVYAGNDVAGQGYQVDPFLSMNWAR